MSTINDVLSTGLDNSPAISAPGAAALSYGELRSLAANVRKGLNALDVTAGDRVAIVLPNGPEMATAFLTVGTLASTAPLNPAYRKDEFEFYLSDLKAKLLIVEKGSQSPALEAAAALNLPVVELEISEDGPAGLFEFEAMRQATGADDVAPASADNEGLVLHTSGTTSRPKIVPLKQSNLAASASNIATRLALTSEDRGLNIMPLFHIHGLIASLLSSMSVGAHVCCTPGFNALKIFAWFDEIIPTWYTAVPTMHQAILSRAKRNQNVIEKLNLRFIRSSSSSLPPPVMAELEETFNAPVVEAYGMTEAAHQMASNLLPPGARKAGTVGTAAGPEVAIMDENSGALLPAGSQGEIVIRGNNVFSGYDNNPSANADAFRDGWFRTGDLGVLDDEGYLSITGRLKEIINRGGEKIAPREVDDVIQAHPAVDQVVTFALPHDKLGEDVAAIIVLKEGSEATDREIKDFASQSLADFKVPRTILFKEEIPKGATGKLQRIGLAEKLGLTK